MSTDIWNDHNYSTLMIIYVGTTLHLNSYL